MMLSTPRGQKAAWFVIGVLCFVAAMFPLYLIAFTAEQTSLLRDTSKTNRATLERVDETLDRIVDCTEPPGECYVRSQTTAKEMTEYISRTVIYAVACAERRGPQTGDVIQQCVTEAMQVVGPGEPRE